MFASDVADGVHDDTQIHRQQLGVARFSPFVVEYESDYR